VRKETERSHPDSRRDGVLVWVASRIFRNRKLDNNTLKLNNEIELNGRPPGGIAIQIILEGGFSRTWEK
jgi:hypothetical protein